MKSCLEAHVLRLSPGQDPKAILMEYVRNHNISAASIASGVGSLALTIMRFANQKESVKLEGFREVVSISGTLCADGAHLHLSVSDSEGATVGGHLMDGSKVHTTLEIVLLAYPEVKFERILDPQTNFLELLIKDRAGL